MLTGYEAIALILFVLGGPALVALVFYRVGYARGQFDGWHRRDRARGLRGLLEPWL